MPETTFSVGDLAILPMPAGATEVRVIEDRGNLGVGGRRILRIEVLDGDVPTEIAFEVPEELLEPDTPEAKKHRRMAKAARRRITKPPAAA